MALQSTLIIFYYPEIATHKVLLFFLSRCTLLCYKMSIVIFELFPPERH